MKDLSHLYERKFNIIKSLLSPFDYEIKEIKRNSKGDLEELIVNVEGKEVTFINNFFSGVPFGVQRNKVEETVYRFSCEIGLIPFKDDIVRIKYKNESRDSQITYHYFGELCTDKIPRNEYVDLKINDIENIIDKKYSIKVPYYYRDNITFLEFTLVKLKCDIECEYRYNNSIVIDYKGSKDTFINSLINSFETKKYKEIFKDRIKNVDSLYEIGELFKNTMKEENEYVMFNMDKLFRKQTIEILNQRFENGEEESTC